MEIAVKHLEMEERQALSRPYRLGTQRRASRRGVRSEAERGGKPVATRGASRARGLRAPSLDTNKVLSETTVAEWLQTQETEQDRYYLRLHLHRVLTDTIYKIWQSHARNANSLPRGTAEQESAYEKAYAKAVAWEKQHFRLLDCQKEWIGYRASCCRGATRPVAIPIHCNHRLCPLCAWNRAERARKRVRSLFGRLTHPVLITLTIPNLDKIRKHDFTLFRQRVRSFIKQHSDWIRGGIYALETTYNRQQKTWHIHVHILADVATPLPSKQDRITFAGKEMYLFTLQKMRLEFDWMRLWSGSWGKRVRTDASAMRRAGDDYSFQSWVEQVRAHEVKQFKFWNGQKGCHSYFLLK